MHEKLIEACKKSRDRLLGELEELNKNIRKLEERWYPPAIEGWGVGICRVIHGSIDGTRPYNKELLQVGAIWPTATAAQAQIGRDIFHRRLCRLAADLQGGDVGGIFEAVWDEDELEWYVGQCASGALGGLFSTCFSAGEAVKIMNRDGWRLPAGVGGYKEGEKDD